MDLHGKRTLMTGATGALGSSLVEAFLALGADVLAADRRRTALDALRADMRHHERLEVAECDVADPAGAESLFEAWTRRGAADVVVHAGGAYGGGVLEDHDDDALRAVIDENLLGAAVVLRAALRRMRPAGRGSVVMIAGEDEPRPDRALAAATQAAVRHLVAAHAGAAGGVRVNAVVRGVASDDDRDQRRAVVRAAVWLASDASEGIDGAMVRAEGARITEGASHGRSRPSS